MRNTAKNRVDLFLQLYGMPAMSRTTKSKLSTHFLRCVVNFMRHNGHDLTDNGLHHATQELQPFNPRVFKSSGNMAYVKGVMVDFQTRDAIKASDLFSVAAKYVGFTRKPPRQVPYEYIHALLELVFMVDYHSGRRTSTKPSDTLPAKWLPTTRQMQQMLNKQNRPNSLGEYE